MVVGAVGWGLVSAASDPAGRAAPESKLESPFGIGVAPSGIPQGLNGGGLSI